MGKTVSSMHPSAHQNSATNKEQIDISMPVMDSLTATREKRHFDKSAGLPRTAIIILTAVLSADLQQEAQMSGKWQVLDETYAA